MYKLYIYISYKKLYMIYKKIYMMNIIYIYIIFFIIYIGIVINTFDAYTSHPGPCECYSLYIAMGKAWYFHDRPTHAAVEQQQWHPWMMINRSYEQFIGGHSPTSHKSLLFSSRKLVNPPPIFGQLLFLTPWNIRVWHGLLWREGGFSV